MPDSASSHTSLDQPSDWVRRFVALIAPGEVLDLACGDGRHVRLLAHLGHPVVAVDRDATALAKAGGPGIDTRQIDLEDGSLWPFRPEQFSGIVVTNYLHRPLFPHIVRSLAPGGVLIYETFAQGNEHFGKPSNPAFLLRHGELLQVLASDSLSRLHVLAFEDGYVDQPKPAMVQRICAVKGAAIPERMHLI